MKKLFVAATTLTVLLLFGCESSFEKDVRKIARLTCEAKKLDHPKSEEASEMLEQARKKMLDFNVKLIEKYDHEGYSWVMDKRSNRIFEEVMKNCK
jgi:outer membrane murein-binding lipoprotein Lpp